MSAADEIYERIALRMASRYASRWKVGDRVRDRYTNQTGTVLARTQDCDWAVEWDDGRVTHVDGYDWEPIHPLEDLAQEAE